MRIGSIHTINKLFWYIPENESVGYILCFTKSSVCPWSCRWWRQWSVPSAPDQIRSRCEKVGNWSCTLGVAWRYVGHSCSWGRGHHSRVGGCRAIHSVVGICALFFWCGDESLMADPDVTGVGVHGYGVDVHLSEETLVVGEHGFSVCFVGAVNLGMRKVEPGPFHRLRHDSCSWVGWRWWSGTTAAVTSTAAANGDEIATTYMGLSRWLSVMNLGQVIKYIELLMNFIIHWCSFIYYVIYLW